MVVQSLSSQQAYSLKSLKDFKMSPNQVKNMIEKNARKNIPGVDESERARLFIEAKEAKHRRLEFIENTNCLIEMQTILQDRKFRNQVLSADDNTQQFFN